MIFFENRAPRKETLGSSKALSFFPSFWMHYFYFGKQWEIIFSILSEDKLFFSRMAVLVLAYEHCESCK